MVNYVDISSDETENILNIQRNLTNQDVKFLDKFLGTLTLLINGVPKFSQSFVSTLLNDYDYFDIGFGTPSGGYYIADKMAPSKLGVYDDIDVTVSFENISITSPIYTYNDDVVSMPSTVRDMVSLRVDKEEAISAPSGTSTYSVSGWDNNLISLNFREKEDIKYFAQVSENNSQDFEQDYDVSQIEKVTIDFVSGTGADRIVVDNDQGGTLHDSGFVVSSSSSPYRFDVDVTFLDIIKISVYVGVSSNNASYSFIAYFKKVYNDNNFVQVPITFEGINQSASIDVGICNDVHLSWQSNRDRYWDVYYSNSVNELSPFRHDTQITKTENNSIRPSVSVSRNGSRMITWNDDRKGNYGIYSARSLSGYDCNQKTCETRMVQSFSDQISQCSVSVDFTAASTGTYNFILYFYSDNGLNNLYKSIPLEGNEDRWYLDEILITNSLIYDDGVLQGVELSEGQTVSVSYVPDKDDGIFDLVLYAKLNFVVN
jgi:hypothetical protein